MKKNVLLTGGTGFIGKDLTTLLLNKGYSISILSRSEKQNQKDLFYYKWDVAKQTIEEEAVLKADYIIHLTGENIAEKRWTPKRKAAIIESREQATQLLYSVLKKHHKKLTAFISASAVGYYGAINGTEICTEETPAANDFLGYTCQKWEESIDFIENLNIRTVKIRTGLVLGKNGGFLKKLIPLFKYRLGAILGSGKQYMPWIHIDDLSRMYYHALTNETLSGPYNAAIHDDTTNAIFSKTLAQLYGYSIWLPHVPAFVLKMSLGEIAKIILTGRRVSCDKIKQTGFEFKYNNLKEALKDCVAK